MSAIAQNALLETAVTRGNERASFLKSNEKTEGSIGGGVDTLVDLATVLPDYGHDENPGNSGSIAESKGKRRSNRTLGTGSINRTSPIESLVDAAEPVGLSETQDGEQEHGSTSKPQQPTRTTRRRNQRATEAVLELPKPSELVTEEAEDQEEREEEASEDEMQGLEQPSTVQTRPRRALATVEEEDWEEEEPQSGRENNKSSRVAKVAMKPRKQHGQLSKARAIPSRIAKRNSAIAKESRKQRPQRLSASGEGVPEENQATSGPKTSREAVAITVHRLSRLQALQNWDDEEDILYGPPPFPKRNGVNAADVMAQACREIITKIVEKVDAAAENRRSEATKGEWKTKKKAAETFGTELEGRLFDMVSLCLLT